MTITQLREKRANAWEQAKNFLDTHQKDGMLSAEDAAQYDRMEADIDAMTNQINRLERADKLNKDMQAPTSSAYRADVGGAGGKTGKRATVEYRDAFWRNIRNKLVPQSVTDVLEEGTDANGGYLVPEQFEANLVNLLAENNIMRSLGTVMQIGPGDHNIPVVATHGTASWIAESGSFTDSGDTFGLKTLSAHKVGTLMKVSVELLSDSVFNLEAYIAEEFARRIGAAEEAAFIAGDGSGKPTGVMTGLTASVTAASSTAITTDELLDLVYSLKPAYRKNAQFLLNDTTVKAIRKLKDSNGQYLWQPGLMQGQPDTLVGYKANSSDSVPTIAAGKTVAMFGDFSYYWIGDRQGRVFQKLIELYAANGQAGFLGYQRVDGKLMQPDAIASLAMKAASGS